MAPWPKDLQLSGGKHAQAPRGGFQMAPDAAETQRTVYKRMFHTVEEVQVPPTVVFLVFVLFFASRVCCLGPQLLTQQLN